MPIYSDGDFGRIAAAIGVDAMVVAQHKNQLEAAACWFRLDRGAKDRVAPSILKRKLEQIEKSARRLLSHLSVVDLRDAPDGPGDPAVLAALASTDDGIEDTVMRATARVGRLGEMFDAIDAARDLEQRARQAQKDTDLIGNLTVPKGHHGDTAIDDWIAAMLPLYRDITGAEPATSVGAPGQLNDGIAGGPLIRFLKAASEPLDIAFDEDAWRSRVRTVLKGPAVQN